MIFFLMIVLKVSFKFLHPHLPLGFLVPRRHGKVKPNLITWSHLAMSVCSESLSPSYSVKLDFSPGRPTDCLPFSVYPVPLFL